LGLYQAKVYKTFYHFKILRGFCYGQQVSRYLPVEQAWSMSRLLYVLFCHCKTFDWRNSFCFSPIPTWSILSNAFAYVPIYTASRPKITQLLIRMLVGS